MSIIPQLIGSEASLRANRRADYQARLLFVLVVSGSQIKT